MTQIGRRSRLLQLIALGLSVIALLVALFALRSRNQGQSTGARANETFERVMSSGELRAAYISYPPSCVVDPATGEVSGIFVDILGLIADKLDLELRLTEEVGWATMIQGLNTHRYDIMANAVWANPVRSKLSTFSNAVYYSPIEIWVRNDEERFTAANSWESINNPEVRIAAMDGSTPEVIATEQFPRASLVTYPDMAGEPQIFLDLVAGKADVFFAEPAVALDFARSNPGTIKRPPASTPVRLFANVFLMREEEWKLKQMIDTVLLDLQTSGQVEEILSRYEEAPGLFYRSDRPFQVPEAAKGPAD